MIVRRPGESDVDWRRRLQLAPLRAQVREARDEYTRVAARSALSRRVIRLCAAALLVGALLVLLGVALTLVASRTGGLAGPIVACFVTGGVATLAGATSLSANWDDHADHDAPLVIARRAYDEAFAEYVDAGGGVDVSDALLTLDRT